MHDPERDKQSGNARRLLSLCQHQEDNDDGEDQENRGAAHARSQSVARSREEMLAALRDLVTKEWSGRQNWLAAP